MNSILHLKYLDNIYISHEGIVHMQVNTMFGRLHGKATCGVYKFCSTTPSVVDLGDGSGEDVTEHDTSNSHLLT